jgi:hypothetical protein
MVKSGAYAAMHLLYRARKVSLVHLLPWYFCITNHARADYTRHYGVEACLSICSHLASTHLPINHRFRGLEGSHNRKTYQRRNRIANRQKLRNRHFHRLRRARNIRKRD